MDELVFTMADLTPDELEIIRRIRAYKQKVALGTSNPDSFFTLTDIERHWDKLISDTNKQYSAITADLIRQIDEKSLISKKKKLSTDPNTGSSCVSSEKTD